MQGEASQNVQLPMAGARRQFVLKVLDNRLVILVGAAGCGKSSQAPQFLLEDFGGPILCTQPRRLATVSVARRVASELGCEIGGNVVGYHVGGECRCTSSTQLVFATAGVQLEEIRAQGFRYMNQYKAIMVDEVHERSPENDLLLACLRELMITNRKTRLVLMSATADFKRYLAYFREAVGEDDVATVAVDAAGPRRPLSLQSDGAATASGAGFQVRVMFIEQVINLLGQAHQADASLLDAVQSCKDSELVARADTMATFHRLCRDLILFLDAREPVESTFLVFLPTFSEIVRQQSLLQASGAELLTRVLHSSVDTDECIAACEPAVGGKERVVILATTIAETSITVPGVGVVIDFCRSCNIYWSPADRVHTPRIEWASHSALEQRKGRTGRTCDGVVYRLLPQTKYRMLPAHERPLLQTQSLRKESLILLAAEDKVLADPHYLLSRTMDPPILTTVDEAIEFLNNVGLAAPEGAPKRGQQRFAATPKGRLVCEMPVGVENALLVLRGARIGRLREAALCAAVECSSPAPVPMAYTGEVERFTALMRGFFPLWRDERDAAGRTLANLAAVDFFDTAFLDAARAARIVLSVHAAAEAAFAVAAGGGASSSRADCLPASAGALRSENKQQLFEEEGPRGRAPTLDAVVASGVPADEAEWCARHGLSRIAVRATMEAADVVQRAVWRYRPLFLAGGGAGEAAAGVGWEEPFQNSKPHKCEFLDPDGQPKAALLAILDPTAHRSEGKRTAAAEAAAAGAAQPCDSALPSLFHLYSETTVKELMALLAQRRGLKTGGAEKGIAALASRGIVLCRFFTTSSCRNGDRCRFSHGAQEDTAWADSIATVAIPEDIPELEADPFAVSVADRHGLQAMLQRLCARREASLAQAQQQQAGGAGRGGGELRGMVVTIGDGDFSFSAALVADGIVPPDMLVATVLGSEDETQAAYNGARGTAAHNAAFLRDKGAAVLYGLDATAIRLSPDTWTPWASTGSGGGGVAGGGGLRGTIWSGVPWWAGADGLAVVWQFPFTGKEEDTEGNRDLLAAAFASIAAAWLAAGVWHNATLFLTLCNDQFSRWGVQRAARDAFFFLQSSAAFDLHGFSGYAPMRNAVARGDREQGFYPPDKPVTFAFRLRPPPAGSGAGLEAAVREAAAVAWRQVAAAEQQRGAGGGRQQATTTHA